MELFNPDKLNFDFVSKFKFFTAFVVLVMIASVALFVKPGLNYGIDFKGGVEAHISFGQNQVTAEAVREALADKTTNLSIVEIDSAKEKEFFVTIQESDTGTFANVLAQELAEKFGDQAKVLKLDIVGPQVGAELRKSALLSMIYTCILICLYMYWRFDFRYAPGALLSVFHDIVATLGFLSLTQMEFSTSTVAALLTLAGYSINDTVVVFDRIRELEAKLLGADKKTLLNRALNSTLSRTTLTSGTTLISCVVLYLVGGESLRVFAATLFFGIIVGTYSSVFIAAPAYLKTDELLNQQPKAKARTA